KHWEARFGVELLPDTRAAFGYRYYHIDRNVLGSFDLNDADRTRYRGAMTGYVVGVYHDEADFGVGAFHSPPMRGKSEIQGEQKIITAPGTYGLDLVLKGLKNTQI